MKYPMKVKIKRDRYIVIRYDNGGLFVWCGSHGDHYFKSFNDIGDTEIKTYRSEKQARNALDRRCFSKPYEVRPVLVTMEEWEPITL